MFRGYCNHSKGANVPVIVDVIEHGVFGMGGTTGKCCTWCRQYNWMSSLVNVFSLVGATKHGGVLLSHIQM